MKITVSGKNFNCGEALQTHVGDSLGAIVEKYFGAPLDASVIFSQAGHLFKADISAHVTRGISLQSHAEATDAHAAYQAAVDKLEKRLSRHKDRVRNHHTKASRKEIEALEAQKFILSGESEENEATINEDGSPAIIAEMSMPIETLSVADAVMRLDLGNLPALMFRNQANSEFNMIYRRPDGNIGWVDPKGSKKASA